MFLNRKLLVILIILFLLPLTYLYFFFDVEDFLVAKTIPLYPLGSYVYGVRAHTYMFSFGDLSPSGASAHFAFVIKDMDNQKVLSFYDNELSNRGWNIEAIDKNKYGAASRLYSKRVLLKHFVVFINNDGNVSAFTVNVRHSW